VRGIQVVVPCSERWLLATLRFKLKLKTLKSKSVPLSLAVSRYVTHIT
jgi:hypothetical protein